MKLRDSNIELLRIISMCSIVAIHYFAEHLGGMATNAEFPSLTWFLLQSTNSIVSSLVNCFVLISGYYLINSDKFSTRKVTNLIVITAFYGVIGYIIGILAGITTFSVNGLFYAFFPFFDGKRWFVETYIILILLAPFINKLLNNLNQFSFRLLLYTQFILFSVWYTLGLSAPILDDGYGIINFLTLYMIGAYYRLFGNKSIIANFAKCRLMIGYVLCTLTTFMLSYFINPFGYSFITNIIGALFIFVFFTKLNLGSSLKINKLSSAAFDVYFVHSDSYTSRMLIYEVLKGKWVINTIWTIPHLFITIVVLYVLGIIAFEIRSFLFSKTIDKIINKVKLFNITITI